MATSSTIASVAPRAFQFRLATLLIATMWAALVSLGLRTPTPLWSGVIAVLTLLSVLFAVLLIIYRRDRTRAMAIGYLVFCVGYLTYLTVLAGTLGAGLSSRMTPTGSAFVTVLPIIHPAVSPLAGGFGDITGYGGGFDGSPSTPLGLRFNPADFVAICNLALASLLAVVGGVAAQVLFASQKDDGSRKDDAPIDESSAG